MHDLLLRTVLVGTCLTLGGCDPTVEIFGSFFPAWLISLFGGVALSVPIRQLLARIGIEPHLGPLLVVYPSLALLFTMVIWLIFFRS